MQTLRSYQLAVKFYRNAEAVKVPGHTKDQLRRAARIVLNLSEGHGRATMPDRLRFFSIAMGSVRECQAIVELESRAFDGRQRDLLDHLAASTYQLVRISRG